MVRKSQLIFFVLIQAIWCQAYQLARDTSMLFQISRPAINEFDGEISIELVAKQKDVPIDLGVNDLIFMDEKNGLLSQLEVDLIEKIKPQQNDQLTILFLIDVSGSMQHGGKIEGAREAVKTTIEHSRLPEGCSLFLATFHDTVSTNIAFRQDEVESIANNIVATNKDTDLYTAIIRKIRELSSKMGKKAIILLSDGAHDIRNNPLYTDGRTKPTEQMVLEEISRMDENILFFPIGLGESADSTFLAKLPNTSASPWDSYGFSLMPDQLDSIFFRVVSGLSGNYRIHLRGNQLPYIGNERTLYARWVNNEVVLAQDKQIYRAGKVNYPIPVKVQSSFWYKLFGLGLGLLFLLFSLLSLLLPYLKRRDFHNRFVKHYYRQGNRVAYDTVTNEPISDGTLVVEKCRQIIPLQTWQDVGEKCPHFPDCVHSLGCDGSGADALTGNFFTQKGPLRRLNWLWFGSLGGLLAWVLYALYAGRFISAISFHNIIRLVLEKIDLIHYDSNAACLNCLEVANDTYVGVCFGTGLALALAIPNEMSAIRDFSIPHLLLKTLLGSFAGTISFFIGAVIHPTIISSSFFAGLFAWLIFGILLGLSLTLHSEISIKRALIAAPLSCLFSYFVYYFSFMQGWENPEPLRLISLLSLGGIIGFLILTVVNNLEDFELELIAPDYYRGHIVPISKWLQQGSKVTAGTAPKNQVYIKWPDETVLDHHVNFFLQNNNVVIEPMGETLINNRIIEHVSPLADGDIIQLGRHSRTQFRYREKRLEAGKRNISEIKKGKAGKDWP